MLTVTPRGQLRDLPVMLSWLLLLLLLLVLVLPMLLLILNWDRQMTLQP